MTEEPRRCVLIVDDDRLNIQVLGNLLKDEFDVVVALNADEAMERIINSGPHIILLDIQMPGMDGFEFIEKIKRDPESKDIPVIFLSGMVSEEDEKKGLEMGAVDYITKPFRPAVVKARLRNQLELKRQRDLLSRLSSLDGLTGIHNRRRFDEFFHHEWRRAGRTGQALSLIMFDIDYFKPYNDNYGHVAGDETLKEVATAISRSMERGTDFTARYGGEEFVCVLPDTDEEGAAQVAERVRVNIQALSIPHSFSEVSSAITISAGVATARPSDSGITPVQLMENADRALYSAKKNGRNQVVQFEASVADVNPSLDGAAPSMLKPRVLIIDDEPANIKALEMIMKGRYQTYSALRGKEGVELAAQAPQPDLIMLDIQMPGMDGYEVIKRLKQNALTRDIPVIFNSILSDEGNEKNGLDLGAVDYIRKPFHHVVTLARIKTHIRLKKAMDTLSEKNSQMERLLNMRDGVERMAKHDLKLPIGAIIHQTEALLDREDIPKDARISVKTVMAQSYHALDMINRTLDLWKIEHGSYTFTPAPLNIMKVIRRVADEMAILRRGRHIDLAISLRGAPADRTSELMVEGEEWLFHSMLANLVKNAIEAAPDGSSVHTMVEDHEGIRITIHNMGAVPVEVRGNFFEKHSTLGKKHGAGLGTYISMKISQALGWIIHMDTSEKTGTSLILSRIK